MKIGVMGAGAVGCYYGARLAQGGHDVTLVGRPALVEVVRAKGLRLETASLDEHIALSASTEASALADCDIILFSVKSTDTEEAGRALSPHIRTGAIILSFQNGYDNAERLQAVLNHPVIPVSVYVATEMAGPGHVKHHGRGEIIIGQTPDGERAAIILADAGIGVTLSSQVSEALWTKLTVNCAYNALSAAAQLPYGELMKVEGVVNVMTAAAMECTAVGQALGLAIGEPDLKSILGIAGAMPGMFSSTAQDIARGKRTEIDHLNGYVVRKGREMGISTPVNETLFVAVKLIEYKL